MVDTLYQCNNCKGINVWDDTYSSPKECLYCGKIDWREVYRMDYEYDYDE